MNEENTLKLINSFPNLYKYHPLFPNEDMEPHFDCEDGWFQIIWDLSVKLETEIVRIKKEEKREVNEFPYVEHVKINWGALYFSVGQGNEKMCEDISEATEKSAEICEICGKPGRLNIDVEKEEFMPWWLKTRCDKDMDIK